MNCALIEALLKNIYNAAETETAPQKLGSTQTMKWLDSNDQSSRLKRFGELIRFFRITIKKVLENYAVKIGRREQKIFSTEA